MTWVKLDDSLHEHEKIIGLSDRAFRLHITALCYSARNLTDGRITPRAVKVLSAILSWSTPRRFIHELVAAGIWEQDDDGYIIHDFLHFNPSAAQVQRDRKRARERMAERRSSECSTEHPSNALARGRTPSRPGGKSLAIPPRSLQDPASGKGAETNLDVPNAALVGRLVAACGGGKQAQTKIIRTLRAHRSSESDVAWAIESATGPNVREPLAVALAELKKRGVERKERAA